MTIWNPSTLPYERFVKQQAKGISDIATLFELLTYISKRSLRLIKSISHHSINKSLTVIRALSFIMSSCSSS